MERPAVTAGDDSTLLAAPLADTIALEPIGPVPGGEQRLLVVGHEELKRGYVEVARAPSNSGSSDHRALKFIGAT